jgi:hypothetical protein
MHSVHNIALGFLIACMLLAGAKVLHKSTMTRAAGRGGRT